MWVFLLIVHGLVSVLLLGALTHQLVSLCWNPRRKGILSRFASVPSPAFTKAVTYTYVINFAVGAWIYTHYRYNVKNVLEDIGLHVEVGLFELKEHVAAVALLLIPAYWFYWCCVSQDEQRGARIGVTGFLAFSSWLSFLVGHVVNNARGF